MKNFFLFAFIAFMLVCCLPIEEHMAYHNNLLEKEKKQRPSDTITIDKDKFHQALNPKWTARQVQRKYANLSAPEKMSKSFQSNVSIAGYCVMNGGKCIREPGSPAREPFYIADDHLQFTASMGNIPGGRLTQLELIWDGTYFDYKGYTAINLVISFKDLAITRPYVTKHCYYDLRPIRRDRYMYIKVLGYDEWLFYKY